MNREIKFRAYDPIKKEMWYNQFCISATGIINKREIAKEWNSWKNEDWILLQYTGIKDKNDKEIYEGDIIKCQGKMLKVVYDPFHCGFVAQCISGNNQLDIRTFDIDEDLEVMGNIYEDPESL